MKTFKKGEPIPRSVTRGSRWAVPAIEDCTEDKPKIAEEYLSMLLLQDIRDELQELNQKLLPLLTLLLSQKDTK